jgi:hypothetical protein
METVGICITCSGSTTEKINPADKPYTTVIKLCWKILLLSNTKGHSRAEFDDNSILTVKAFEAETEIKVY